MRIAAAIGLMLLLTMCQNKSPYGREMASIAALQVAVDSARSQAMKIDTIEIREAEQAWKEKLNFIVESYQRNGDSIDGNLAEILMEYRQTIALASWTAAHTELLLGELTLTRNQLDNLYHDLAYNLLDAEDVRMAYNAEGTAADSVISRVAQLKATTAEKLYMAPDVEMKVDSVIERLKTN